MPNFADVDSAESMRIGAGVLDALAVTPGEVSDVPKDPGGPLEQHVRDDLARALPGLDPDRGWIVSRGVIITKFDQYEHLSTVDELVRANPGTGITIGTDYLIKPDVTVALGSLCPPLLPAAPARRSRQMDHPPDGCRTSSTSAYR